MLEVTKIIEWDMGHRVPNHKNKCRNLHGHRYRLEVSVRGNLRSEHGASDEGMVVDFGDLKGLLLSEIANKLDHQFMYYEHDQLLREFFGRNTANVSSLAVPFIPTAENIVLWCFQQLQGKLPAGLTVSRCKLYETPNSWAEYRNSALD